MLFKCNRKKHYLYIFSILWLVLLIGCSANKGQQSAIVSYVVDGDTFDIMFNNKEERVRLLLVDTPETKHPSKPVQPFGKEASQFTKAMLEGKEVKVELDVSERDQYGRLLAYIWVDGKMFNEMLLEKGLARVAYVYAPNTKYVDRFNEVQKQAQKKGVGIWSIEDYVRENGFNHESNIINDSKPNIFENEDCTIKGNINSKGEKIYHTIGSPSYLQTKPEVMFCSEAEAKAAGFRAPYN